MKYLCKKATWLSRSKVYNQARNEQKNERREVTWICIPSALWSLRASLWTSFSTTMIRLATTTISAPFLSEAFFLKRFDKKWIAHHRSKGSEIGRSFFMLFSGVLDHYSCHMTLRISKIFRLRCAPLRMTQWHGAFSTENRTRAAFSFLRCRPWFFPFWYYN